MERRKRKYRSSLAFVEVGFRACLLNANDLVLASQTLLSANLHAPALSLSVLALEELGKLHAIDGLLFARADDHKSAAFDKSGKSHQTKLEKFLRIPMFLWAVALVLAVQDPAPAKANKFNEAIAIALQDLRKTLDRLTAALPNRSLLGLDRMKQAGFYCEISNGNFKAPREAVEPAIASEACHLAWRAATTAEFLFKDGNMDRYLGMARSIRGKLSDSEHRNTEEFAHRIINHAFNEDEQDLPRDF
jgi:AbiV family abortive infection protein